MKQIVFFNSNMTFSCAFNSLLKIKNKKEEKIGSVENTLIINFYKLFIITHNYLLFIHK